MVKIVRVGIVETSKTLRYRIKEILSCIEGVEVVADTDDQEELPLILKKKDLDVLILEIEMQGLGGIKIASLVNYTNPSIKVIFIALDEKYLNDAFSVYAYDYLVKPLDEGRLIQSIKRIQRSKMYDYELARKSQYNKSYMVENRLLIECEGVDYFINLREVIFITRYDRKVVIVTKKKRYLTWSTLSNIEKRLPSYFFRSHKGYIINLKNINKITPLSAKTYEVYFNDCNENALMTLEKFKLLKKYFDRDLHNIT